ncbi:hypothetical protein SSX86_031715 [Deinandra increscens subsp. villosa]|uniref:Uncharacterized protein n=1 Tax=Deinandra increscens subsp. villosa TaxID=3103831 RepID=A0AAP0GHY6_9ASTR
MASAILPSRTDPRSSDFMSKFSENVNSNLNFTRLQNISTPNPNPNSKQVFIGNAGRDVLWKNHQPLPSSVPPERGFIGSSINSVPANSSGYRYITFRLDSYTRRELKALKKRLMSDLERVRILRQFVCSTPTPKMYHHAPPLESPAAPEAHLPVNGRQKNAIGQKRAKPLPPVRDTKKQCGRVTNAQRRKSMMRECVQILGKLMRHKHGWVFNTPVDAAALKLYDYHNVISQPMDLGTIKSKLTRNEYESPLSFASDVRLTFQNAMLYNGKGSDVFIMAERLLLLFEDMFNSTHPKFVINQPINNEPKKPNCCAGVPISVGKSLPNAIVVGDAEGPVAPQTKALNLGKDMTDEEKAELAASLWDLQLGPEGMGQMMSIVKKGVGLEHEGNEIELDLAVLDNETLWELHSFIGNRKGVITNYVPSSLACESVVEEESRERDAGEEFVDIGEEMQLTDLPLIEIEKDGVNGSSSSSDSSSESDSSSSDSGSSGNSYNEQEVNSTTNGVVP